MKIVTAPKEAVTTATAKIRVMATVGSTIRAFVEGVAQKDVAAIGAECQADLEVALSPGRNRVSFVGFTDQGLASPAATVDVVRQGAAGAHPRTFVIAIGISRYPRLGASAQLRVADDDARALAEFFGRQGATTKVLTDENASVARIEETLASLAATDVNDTSIVLFAGHGVTLSSGETVLLTSETGDASAPEPGTFVSWKTIARHVGEARGHVLVLVDACHSGSLSRDLVTANGTLAAALAAAQRAGVLVFAAARGRQVSHEGPWMGVFSAAVLDTVSDSTRDLDHDGYVDADELIASVTQKVNFVTKGRQVPWVMRREMFGGFRVARVGLQ